MRNLSMMGLLVALMVAAFAAVAYANIITGTNRDNRLVGTEEKDYIAGWGGQDTIFGKVMAAASPTTLPGAAAPTRSTVVTAAT